MTAFSPSQLPASINTLEKLNAWSGIILSELYTSITAVEEGATVSRVAQSSPFLVTSTNPAVWRLVNRTSFSLTGTWRRSGSLWLQVDEIGTIAIPAQYSA